MDSGLPVPMRSNRDPESPVGLFDFKDYWDLVQTVSQVLHLRKEEVQERLFYETLETGWNVSRAARAFGVTPHVYNKRMEEFYKQTDAFVFDLLVGHLNRYCQEIDQGGLMKVSISGKPNGHNE